MLEAMDKYQCMIRDKVFKQEGQISVKTDLEDFYMQFIGIRVSFEKIWPSNILGIFFHI